MFPILKLPEDTHRVDFRNLAFIMGKQAASELEIEVAIHQIYQQQFCCDMREVTRHQLMETPPTSLCGSNLLSAKFRKLSFDQAG